MANDLGYWMAKRREEDREEEAHVAASWAGHHELMEAADGPEPWFADGMRHPADDGDAAGLRRSRSPMTDHERAASWVLPAEDWCDAIFPSRAACGPGISLVFVHTQFGCVVETRQEGHTVGTVPLDCRLPSTTEEVVHLALSSRKDDYFTRGRPIQRVIFACFSRDSEIVGYTTLWSGDEA